MNILVLGAGDTKENYYKWDNFFNSKNYTWYGVTLEPFQNKNNLIKLDFNSLDDLRKLIPVNTFDLILFDWSTVKFIKWNTIFIYILISKLKNKGQIYLPVESFGSKPYQPSIGIKYDYTILKQNLDDKVESLINNDNNVLLLGKNYPIDSTPSIWSDDPNYHKDILKYEENVIDKHNRDLFEQIFSNVEIKYGNYPLLDNKIRKYFILTRKQVISGGSNKSKIELHNYYFNYIKYKNKYLVIKNRQ